MDPTNEAAAGGSEQIPATIVTADGDGKLSVAAAARALASARHKPREQEQALEQRLAPASAFARAGTAGAGASAEAVQESSPAPSGASEDAGDLRSPQGEGGPPGGTESVDPASSSAAAAAAEESPPIEPPRSWTKADKELFTSLPRETQMRIAERERSREGDFLRRQAEAAEKLKGLAAREQAVDQARLQYEAALPQLLLTLNDQQAAEFADIKTLADAERVAREDWPRYMRWDLAQKKLAFAQQQMLEAQLRQVTEQQQKFAHFAKRQDELFIEKVPEFGDARKAAELQSAAVTVLKELGFDDAELAASWQGRQDFSLRDHRVQLLVRDAALWREAQQKAKAAVAKPMPPVQRPGVSHPKGAAQDAVIQNLNKQLENASGVNALRTAAKLVAARRETRRA
jgi:hypothetical protein